MRDNDVSDFLVGCLGLVALIAIMVFLKAFAVQWLWNSVLIEWAGLALPIMSWGKAFFVGVALSIAVNGFSGSSKKK